MSQGWDSLPLLPLRCILDHLSTEDALAATSTCHHWRTALLLYEGRKDTLKLRTRHLEKNMFLTRLFRKYTKRLLIYLDGNEEQLQKFVNYILPQYFDAVKLQEIMFIGPSYYKVIHNESVKLKRIITETLVFKHLHTIKRLAFMFGCEMGIPKNENERHAHRHVEYYSKPLMFNIPPSAADAVLTRYNASMMVFSTLQHVIFDYDHINTEALESLAQLKMFSQLTLNVCRKRNLNLQPMDWDRLNVLYNNRLNVIVNIVSLSCDKLEDVMENVLVDGLPLISLKVMFCETVYEPLLSHIVRLYKESLHELVWVDSPYDPPDSVKRLVRCYGQDEYEMCNINPFVLLCWQCVRLRRLVIHGYWVWLYDVVGFARLRSTLRQLEVSAVYDRSERLAPATAAAPASALRVLVTDTPMANDPSYIDDVNEYTMFKWQPTPWSKLHPGLRARSNAEQRASYVLYESRRPSPLGVT